MDHLFHPWHYIPIIAALPFLGMLWSTLRYKIANRGENAQEAEDHSQGP
jgi:hypothetical protein